MSETLAFDQSARRRDENGHLHVDNCRLSKATVNPYRGIEIPEYEKLGLSPDRIYQLWRHPDELAKGAHTWSGLTLLSKHKGVDETGAVKPIIAGAIGTNAHFELPFVIGDLSIWWADDIEDVDTRKKCQLSSSYRYDADMTPGTSPEGLPYDGIMRNIRANHVALVETGRAGPDVMVHDAALEDFIMPTTLLSRTAVMAKGALTAYLAPRLKPGATLALDAALDGVTCFTWSKRRADIATAIVNVATPKLAMDAKLDDLPAFLGALDAKEDGEEDDMEAMDADLDEEEKAEEKRARDAEMKEGMKAEDRRKAMDARRAARDAKRAADKAARDKKAKDAKKPGTDAEGETEAEREARERREADDKAKDKKAMDEAIGAAEKRVVARMTATAQAREDVRPVIGAVSLAMDSAAGIYELALKHMKVDLTDVPPEAFRPVFLASAKAQAKVAPVLAMDHAANSSLIQRFPGLARIRHS